MNRTKKGTPQTGASRTGYLRPTADTPLVGIRWSDLVGAGMTPEMQVLYLAAREKRQVR